MTFRQPIILTTLSALMVILPTAPAQVVLDGTLGSSGPLSGPNYKIGAELGQQRGKNLFHSFERFGLTSSESAIFSGPNSVNNIISRVTGGNPSNIDGTIRSNIPKANLYFLNPYGIMFGPNAKLDVQGSFHASTADTLRFEDGSQFNARNPGSSSLTVAPIEAFGFLSGSPAALSVTGSELSVNPGQTLSFIGGNLSIDKAKLTAPFGRMNLASFAGTGDVIPKYEDLSVSKLGGNFRIAGESEITTTGDGGGAIYIRGGKIVVENSVVESNTEGADAGKGINVKGNDLTLNDGRLVAETYGTGDGGNITIDVVGLVELLGEKVPNEPTNILKTLISTRTHDKTEGAGAGGHIEIKAGQLNLTKGRHIGSLTRGSGQGGHIHIIVTDSLTIDGADSSAGFSVIGTQADNKGNAGNIVLKAKEVILKKGVQISSITLNHGNSGDITIEGIRLRLVDGVQVQADTKGKGQGGNIYVNMAESISISGSPLINSSGRKLPNGFFSSSTPQGPPPAGEVPELGDAGKLVLEADQLNMSDRAVVSALTAVGEGQGGKIAIKVRQLNLIGKSQISARSVAGARGKGGEIELDVTDLYMREGSYVTTSTNGPGEGGRIKINVRNLNMVEKSSISAGSSPPPPPADPYNGPMGDAGNITLNVADSLRMQSGSSIGTNADLAGGGKIDITFQGALLHLSDSNISSSVQAGEGGGGDMTITGDLILLEDSDITAQADEGPGGNITIKNLGLVKTSNSLIDASSKLGIDGEVLRTGREENFEELLRLRDNFLRAEDQLLGKRCAGLTRDDLSTFRITIRDTPAENSTDLKKHLILDW